LQVAAGLPAVSPRKGIVWLPRKGSLRHRFSQTNSLAIMTGGRKLLQSMIIALIVLLILVGGCLWLVEIYR